MFLGRYPTKTIFLTSTIVLVEVLESLLLICLPISAERGWSELRGHVFFFYTSSRELRFQLIIGRFDLSILFCFITFYATN